MKPPAYVYAIRWGDGQKTFTAQSHRSRARALAQAKWLRANIDLNCWVRRMKA